MFPNDLKTQVFEMLVSKQKNIQESLGTVQKTYSAVGEMGTRALQMTSEKVSQQTEKACDAKEDIRSRQEMNRDYVQSTVDALKGDLKASYSGLKDGQQRRVYVRKGLEYIQNSKMTTQAEPLNRIILQDDKFQVAKYLLGVSSYLTDNLDAYLKGGESLIEDSNN